MEEPELFPWGGNLDAGVRYYSLARFALLDALKLLGVGRGARVLLPEFICRDLLAPLALLGAEPCWYALNAGLAPAEDFSNWPEAEVVLVINYFGFPQKMEPFHAYARRTGAVIIEDNAHGYLSRDLTQKWLGTRAALGLFSLRKTLRVPDGAALLVSDPSLMEGVPHALPFDGPGLNPAQAWKLRMRGVPIIGLALVRAAIVARRLLRRLLTGKPIPASSPMSEVAIPAEPNPWGALPASMARQRHDEEITRRRRAYIECAATAERYGVNPVFAELPEYCAPYGFAFRCDPVGLAAMQRLADYRGFDLVSWPELPLAIQAAAPEYYRDVLLINFLW